MPDSKAKKAWIKANTTTVALKLNRNTDADIIKQLETQPNKNGYIKELIRQDLEKSKN